VSSEQRGFVFGVTFIVVFATLLSTIPVGLQGQGNSPDMVIPVDPKIISGFSDTADYQKSDFIPVGSLLVYEYNALGGRNWKCEFATLQFSLGAKIFYGGFLWLGTVDSVKFVSSEGIDREDRLSLAEIEEDSIDGVMRYTLTYYANGASAGGFVTYWNTTTYDNSTHAWDNNGLFLVHGVGFSASATSDIGSLLVSLLFLQLPEVPLLINILLVVPIWASIIFVLWFIIKEMIPFV